MKPDHQTQMSNLPYNIAKEEHFMKIDLVKTFKANYYYHQEHILSNRFRIKYLVIINVILFN